jgi:hypothetical protein
VIVAGLGGVVGVTGSTVLGRDLLEGLVLRLALLGIQFLLQVAGGRLVCARLWTSQC